jgi:hypothetical protein
VNLGDSSKLSIEGKGKIKIYQNDGKKGYISDVYYVPNMKNNILSIGQLLEKGYTIHMENYSLILRDARGGIVAHVPMTNNRMFPLHLNIKSIKSRIASMDTRKVSHGSGIFGLVIYISAA